MVTDRHSNLPPFRSYLRGRKTINYALCSLSILRYVNYSTYEPFKLNTHSDHRGIIVDFSKNLVGRQERLATNAFRGVQSSNPFLVERFLETLKYQWHKLGISNKINTLFHQSLSRSKLREEINLIDTDITKAMLTAEKQTKQHQRPPWSPELKIASLKVRLHKLYLTEFTTGQQHTPAIEYTIKLLQPIEVPKPTNLQECQRQLRKLQRQLKKIRRRAREARSSFLDQLIQQYELSGNTEKQRIVRRIQRAEATKRCYNKLRWILNPPKPGVTFIQQKEADTVRTIYDCLTIEDMILKRNQKHFNQCAGTPFTTGHLRQLNWAADSPLADSILEGNIPTRHWNPYTRTVLRNCQQRTNTLDLSITLDDLSNLFKVGNESTTTSPNGRHLGLYKSIFLDKQDNDILNIQHQLAAVVNASLQHGIGLNRWRRVINVMIHKLQGSYLLDKL